MMTEFRADEAFARELDAADPLAGMRDEFAVPRQHDSDVVYLTGNSLGLMPRGAVQMVQRELDDWAKLAVDAHFSGGSPWYPYHEQFRAPLARLAGAAPHEVVAMNSLTVNLHLLLVSFYRPTAARRKIIAEQPTFPSDLYALQSQIALHGGDAARDLILVAPTEGRHTITAGQIDALFERQGAEVALVLVSVVNYFTGQLFDVPRLTASAQRAGALVGLDLAHAMGNVPLRLHDWNVDFAVWCSYKYLNAGPGAAGGAFVHDRHHAEVLPRFAGWWGNDPKSRFNMHELREFVPVKSADAWQVSNPPILSMAPLKASLALFERAGMTALRAKSELLTSYLEFLLKRLVADRLDIITPGDPQGRGAQLSLVVRKDAGELSERLHAAGVVCDVRRPNVIRAAPVPLYNRFHDAWRFAHTLDQLL